MYRCITVPYQHQRSESRAELLSVIQTRFLPKLIHEPFEEILDAYNEPWRYYHSSRHILRMFKAAEDSGLTDEITSSERQSLYLAILFHDVCYKVGRDIGLNESNSAEFTFKHCNMTRHNKPIIHSAVQAIEATIYHSLDGISNCNKMVTKTLLDLDLMGLGQSPESFMADTEDIWREYEPISTRSEYDTGRAKWAKSFLKRKILFHTSYFRKLESRARRNLSELAI